MLHHVEFLHLSGNRTREGPDHLQTQSIGSTYEASFLSVTRARKVESWLLVLYDVLSFIEAAKSRV